MTKHTQSISAATALIALGLQLSPAHAANVRSFISFSGQDTNNCSRAAPCRTLSTAYGQTVAGGEINMLDPAGYGTVTITHSISIINDGVGSAGILVPSGQIGITINASPGDAVNLRGLIIEGAGVGAVGIQFNSGGFLTITNSVIHGLSQTGLIVAPPTAAKLAMVNTIVADIAGMGTGIELQPTGTVGTLTANLDRVDVYNSGAFGLLVTGNSAMPGVTVNLTATDSTFSGNGNGVLLESSMGAATLNAMLARCAITGNAGIGVQTSGTGNMTVWLAQSTVMGNGSGWIGGGGFVLSYGDNYIDGNAANETAPTLVNKK